MKLRIALLVCLASTAVTPALSGWDSVTWITQESSILFSHDLHVTEQELECVTCHDGVASSNQASDRLFPTMDVCADCHDVEDDELCGTCHTDPENFEASPHPERPITFAHKKHLARGAVCSSCHADILSDAAVGHLPAMATCMNCHDGLTAPDKCAACHDDRVTAADIHPDDWRHVHADVVPPDDPTCAGCHKDRNMCLDCHRGLNLQGWIHDLNYAYTHGLDAGSKDARCSRCHDARLFCSDCHDRLNRIPLDHSQLSWLSEHGAAAKRDTERCESCHNSSDPTCARAGCHGDFDGVLGTDPEIHPRDVGRFEREGPWHEDAGYFCFQCHVSTGSPGAGFCGYCHGS